MADGRWAPLRAAGLPSGCGALSAVRGDPLKADVVYVACGRAGLWRSSDFGASFTRLAASPDATSVATTTDDHLRVLVADADGLALSTNGGRTFRRVARIKGVSAVAFDLRNYLVCYAAAGHTLLRSADGGVTWPRSPLADRLAEPARHADGAHRRAVDAGVAGLTAAGDLVIADELVGEREARAAHLGAGAARR